MLATRLLDLFNQTYIDCSHIQGLFGEGDGNPHQYSYLENPMHEEPDGLPSVGLQPSWT